MEAKIGVLFVCLGNICRSPLAEAVFRSIVRAAGLEHRFDIDSAGTSDYHIGSSPDPRTMHEAQQRGLVLEHEARQLTVADLERFDYVITMDASNRGNVERLARRRRGRAEVHLLRSFDEEAGDDLEVPDPYFGGPEGFADVHDLVERACHGLLSHIRAERGL